MAIAIDQDLISDCLAHQRAAQRQLYDLTLPYLNLVVRRYLTDLSFAKDVLQESYLAIFQKLAQFDPERASFKTWATRITINFCLKRNQQSKRHAAVVLDTEHHGRPISAEALSHLNDQELTDWLKRMPPEFYAVFNLSIVEGYSHQEIAALLGIDPALSRQRLSRARKWLTKACQLDTNGPLRAEYVYQKRLQLLPLLLTVWAFIEGSGPS